MSLMYNLLFIITFDLLMYIMDFDVFFYVGYMENKDWYLILDSSWLRLEV